MKTDLRIFFGFISILGAVGIYPLFARLRSLSNPNPLEKKISFMLFCMMALFVLRIPWEVFDIRFFGRLTYVTGTTLLLAVFLYFETLYRRHMPFFLKLFVALFATFFVIDALFFTFLDDKNHQIAFGASASLITFSIWVIGLARNTSDYTKSENALIRLCLISLPILVAFFLTDMGVIQQYIDCPQLGVIGALLFTFSTFHDQTAENERTSFFMKILKAVSFSGFLTVASYFLIHNVDFLFSCELFAFYLMINLFLRIHYSARDLDGTDNFFGFVKNVVESDKKTLVPFFKGIRDYFTGIEIKLLAPDELQNYDMQGIKGYFDRKQTHILSLFDLRDMIKENNDEVTGQLIDILERHEMSHICKFGEKINIYVVFNYHMAGQSNLIFTQTALISEMSKLIEKSQKL